MSLSFLNLTSYDPGSKLLLRTASTTCSLTRKTKYMHDDHSSDDSSEDDDEDTSKNEDDAAKLKVLERGKREPLKRLKSWLRVNVPLGIKNSGFEHFKDKLKGKSLWVGDKFVSNKLELTTSSMCISVPA
ncbi:hypothetical protein Tco_0345374 [Tanacetum coccineum]